MAAPTKQSAPLDDKTAKKIKDLKIELLKSPTKRGRVKKEIARLLTSMNESKVQSLKSKDESKLVEGKR